LAALWALGRGANDTGRLSDRSHEGIEGELECLRNMKKMRADAEDITVELKKSDSYKDAWILERKFFGLEY